MAPLNVLIVDDDPLIHKTLAAQLPGHDLDFAADASTARRKIESKPPELCFIDLSLGDGGDCAGLDLIPLAASRGVYSVVMSGHDTERHVERAYELGCDDFYSKGNEAANVGRVLLRFHERRDAGAEDSLFAERFVTQDAESLAAIRDALKYASSDLPMMILGPSGTGKTSLARIIHERSRRPGDFVAVNCSAYADDLLEAELFGYRRGAFTGAGDGRKGKLLLADRGTLFLDEVGAMSPRMQTKLLKAIEEKSFYPLGSDRCETSRFRLISATLEDLPSMIKAGRLRFDFFQRIHGPTIELKSLARRKGDILPLVSRFMRGGRRLAFTAEAKERLLRHDWPGNVRELKKFVALLAAGREGRVSAETVNRLLSAVRADDPGAGFATAEQYRLAKEEGLEEVVRRLTDDIIARSLDENGGRRTKVLKDLRVSTRLLYASLERSGHPVGRRPR